MHANSSGFWNIGAAGAQGIGEALFMTSIHAYHSDEFTPESVGLRIGICV